MVDDRIITFRTTFSSLTCTLLPQHTSINIKCWCKSLCTLECGLYRRATQQDDTTTTSSGVLLFRWSSNLRHDTLPGGINLLISICTHTSTNYYCGDLLLPFLQELVLLLELLLKSLHHFPFSHSGLYLRSSNS